jgi:exosortase E/protease (VPEID-CTERM system)
VSPSRFFPESALPRIGAAVLLLSLEIIALSFAVDTADLHAGRGFAQLVADLAPKLVRTLGLAFVLTGAFAAATGASWLAALDASTRWRISRPAVIAHSVFAVLMTLASLRLFSDSAAGPAADWLAAAALAAAMASLVFGSAVFVPVAFWVGFVRKAPFAPLCGLAAAGAVLWIAEWSWIAQPWMRLTFGATATLLQFLRPDAVIDPANSIMRVGRFEVTVAPQCSGYEGVALMFVFGTAWLLIFRREFRLPQALLLIPAGMAVILALNCVRMTVLLLIGGAGAEAVALGGFHSQAGWIAFVAVALALCVVSHRVPWIAVVPTAPARVRQNSVASDRTAAYLLPFLAILAAGMLAQAASGGFEWAYPLRVVAAVFALWRFRRVYAELDWTVGPPGVAIGIAVFVLWIAAERLLGPGTPPTGAPASWTAAPDAARWTWLLFRVLGGVVTVPIAEELAFRGYALRRLQSPDFTAVDLRTFAWMPFLVSSVLFGALHGSRWFVGAVAGMLFAWAAKRRASIGDAAAAHAVANLLLAAWVLVTGDWRLW